MSEPSEEMVEAAWPFHCKLHAACPAPCGACLRQAKAALTAALFLGRGGAPEQKDTGRYMTPEEIAADKSKIRGEPAPADLLDPYEASSRGPTAPPLPNDSGCKNKGGTCGCLKYCADATPGTRVKEPIRPLEEGKRPAPEGWRPIESAEDFAKRLRPSIDGILSGFVDDLTAKERDFIADQFCRIVIASLPSSTASDRT